jgi:predicted DNA-binding transcriptional regulator AlpA
VASGLIAPEEQNMKDSVKLLTVKDLASMLGVNERTCWRLAALAEVGQGDFPKPIRITPRTVRWRQADVERYLAALADR